MTIRIMLPLMAVTILSLTGCAENGTLTIDPSKVISQGVNSVVNVIQGSNQQPVQNNNTAANSNSVDWTPYLRPMQLGCNPPALDNLSASHRASILNKQLKGDPNSDGEKITVYTLNNAIAFGQPLDRIETLRGMGWGHNRLYFKNSGFMTLRPSFALPAASGNSVVENNAKGYIVGSGMEGMSLIFDSNKKSITCDY